MPTDEQSEAYRAVIVHFFQQGAQLGARFALDAKGAGDVAALGVAITVFQISDDFGFGGELAGLLGGFLFFML